MTRTERTLAAAAAWVAAGTACGQVAYSVRSNADDHLHRIDLATGVATDLGLISFGDAEGLAFGPGGALFAIGGTVDELWDITSPPGALIGPTGGRVGIDAGLDYHRGVLYNLNSDAGGGGLYTIDSGTGAAAFVATVFLPADNLAIHEVTGVAYGVDAIYNDQVFTIDLLTGAANVIGGLGLGDVNQQAGTAFGGDTLYALFGDGGMYTINPATGQATLLYQVRDATGLILDGWEGLAIIPAPGAPLLIGLAGLVIGRRRRVVKG